MNDQINDIVQDVTSTAQGTGLAWVDIVGLVFVGLFMLLGIWRGLWWQVIRLLGVIAAVGLARAFTPTFYPTVQETFPEMGEGLVRGILWFSLFVAGIVVASLLGHLGKKALESMQLGTVDRAGGAVVGALTGVLLHGAFLVGLVTLTTREYSSETLEESGSEVLLELLVQKAPLLLDSEAADRLLGPIREDGALFDGKLKLPEPPKEPDESNDGDAEHTVK